MAIEKKEFNYFLKDDIVDFSGGEGLLKWGTFIEVIKDLGEEIIDSVYTTDLPQDYDLKTTWGDFVSTVFSNWTTPGIYPLDFPFNIIYSSYKRIKPFVYKLFSDKIRQILWIKKVCANEGFAGDYTYTRSINKSDALTTSGLSRLSDTPQLDQIDFEGDMNSFQSSFSKDSGSSTRAITNSISDAKQDKSYEENYRNFQLLYFNAMYDLVANIPMEIYNYFSLDSLPIPEVADLFKNYFDQLKVIYE